MTAGRSSPFLNDFPEQSCTEDGDENSPSADKERESRNLVIGIVQPGHPRGC